MSFLTVLRMKYGSFLHLDFVGNELNYKLCKIKGDLTNFSAIFDCITPLCEMPSLSSDYSRKHIPIIQGPVAQNFNGHDMEI